jgi:hypothetical protein
MYLRYTCYATRKKNGKVHRYWRRAVLVSERSRASQSATPDQAQLFSDGSEHVTVPVRSRARAWSARDRSAMCIGRPRCGAAAHGAADLLQLSDAQVQQ